MSLRYRRFHAAGKQFEVDRVWEWQQQRRITMLLAKLKATKQHHTCIVVGNGPSLNSTDLSQLTFADVFISNFAFEHRELLKHAKLLAMVNHLVAEQSSEMLADRLGTAIPLLAPSHLRYALSAQAGTFYLPMATTPEFQLTPRFGASCQSTVTYFLLQVAYWLGYRRVLLIGVDNHYVQPDVTEGQVLKQEGLDLNHFSSTYFQGKQWHAADVDRMAATYELANAAYVADGRSIVDCTVDGRLAVFPKADLAEALRNTVSVDSSVPESGRVKLFQIYEMLEHFCLPLFVGTLLALMFFLLAYLLSDTWISSATLSALLAALAVPLAVSAICIVNRQVRRMEARMRFELSVLRSLIHRQKNT